MAVYHLQLIRDKPAGVIPGKMCSSCPKNHGCGQKKPECSAIFGIGTTAKIFLKCCKLITYKRCADQACSTEHNKDDSSKANLICNLNFFAFHQKDN